MVVFLEKVLRDLEKRQGTAGKFRQTPIGPFFKLRRIAVILKVTTIAMSKPDRQRQLLVDSGDVAAEQIAGDKIKRRKARTRLVSRAVIVLQKPFVDGVGSPSPFQKISDARSTR